MPVGKKSIARMASVTLNRPEKSGIHVEAPEVPKGTPAAPVKKAPAKKKTASQTKSVAPKKPIADPVPDPKPLPESESYAVGSSLPYWLL